ncbi:MAG: hypothetical protein CMP70_03610 [Flavobacteriales bacterium]|nr:hypothetical protein [Flavobacteriales bacterium]|tara:strand:+ start:1795 stop:2403 length:609 start_codon:yes stop_codon:yes gene_type:complete
MMRLAQVISILGHPIFMPLYAFGLLIYTNPYINMMVSTGSRYFIITILVVFTITLPVITALLFKLFGLIDSVFMKTTKERMWPFVITLIWYYTGYQLFNKIQVPQSLNLLMIGTISVISVAIIITIRWKISIHMLGIGGVIGAIIGISQRFQFDHSLLLIVLFLFAGLIGYSRLKTKSHNFQQIYIGFIIGLVIEWICVLYL